MASLTHFHDRLERINKIFNIKLIRRIQYISMWYVSTLNWIQRQDNFDMVSGSIVLTVRVLYHTLNVRGHSANDEMANGYTF